MEGKPHEALGFHCEEVNEDVDGSLMVPLFGGCCFICLEKRVKTFAPMFGVVVCEHNYIILTYCSYTLGWSLFESRILV